MIDWRVEIQTGARVAVGAARAGFTGGRGASSTSDSSISVSEDDFSMLTERLRVACAMEQATDPWIWHCESGRQCLFIRPVTGTHRLENTACYGG